MAGQDEATADQSHNHSFIVMKNKPASWFSYPTLDWMNNLTWKASRHGLQPQDAENIVVYGGVLKSSERLLKLWNEQDEKKGHEAGSLARAIYQFCKFKLVLGSVMAVMSSVFLFVGPAFVLPQMLDFLNDPKKPTWHGIVLILMISLSVFLKNLTYVNSWTIFADAGSCVGSALYLVIFRKIFQIKDCKEELVAKIINHITSDMERVVQCFNRGMLWTGTPAFFIANVVYCYFLIGAWSLLGNFIAIIYCVLMATVSLKLGRYRILSAQWQDKRIKMMHQILTNMKLIKMYAWEEPFLRKIKESRDAEENILGRMICIQSLLFSAIPMISVFAPMFSLIGYVFCGGNLTPTAAFTVVSLFSCMVMPCDFVGISAKIITEGIVSLRRIQATLSSNDSTAPEHDKLKTIEESDAVEIVDASLFEENHTCELKIRKIAGENCNLEDSPSKVGPLKELMCGINIAVKKGQLVGICGVIGSGKSTLLMAISGNFILHRGTINTQGSVALVTQEAVIFSGSVQENILFGMPYDEQRYRSVVSACCLDTDLQIMHKGDQTEIGHRGVNISGGQKQRISLARALYSDRDVYLLDDIFSAVDVRVSDHIFKTCILNMLAQKTVLLVTHSVKVLERCDFILLLKNGVIFESGTHDCLMNEKGEYLEMVLKDKSQRKSVDCEVTEDEPVLKNCDSPDANIVKSENDKRISVAFRSLLFYFKACGGYFASIMMILTIFIFQAMTMFTLICFRKWMDSESGLHSNILISSNSYNSSVIQQKDNLTTFGINVILILVAIAAVVFSAIIKVFAITAVLLKCASTIHKTLCTQVMKCRLSFFELTAIGQTSDRFSKDLDICDSIIPYYLEFVVQIMALTLLQTFYIGVLNPWYFFGILIFIAIYLILDTLFTPSILAFKRLENHFRTPLLTHMSVTIHGMPIIRTFQKLTLFTEKFRSLADKHLAANFIFQQVSNWLRFRADMVGWGFVTATSLMIILERGNGKFSTALAGLVMSMVFSMSSWFSVLMKYKADFIGHLISIERISDYCGNLESEASAIIDDNRPPVDWPSKGTISFRDVKLRYSPELPLVLHGLTVSIKGGEKVGIIGRTGAGKSTFIATLLRLTEICEGSIVIDGIDISEIGLKDLRTKLAVIPQDPVIFEGTIRWNLDPFAEHDDDRIWDALEKAQLKIKISNEPQRLETVLSSDGGTLSVGEKQLLCLARALLRNCKILLMDEATASVDVKTDQCIQNSIRCAFSECTVLTIAHRLNTIADYDKILAMDSGKVIEFDTPSSLMERDSFYRILAVRSSSVEEMRIKKLKIEDPLQRSVISSAFILCTNPNIVMEGQLEAPAGESPSHSCVLKEKKPVGWLSYASLNWMNKLMWKASRQGLEPQDAEKIAVYGGVAESSERLLKLWNEQVEQQGPERASLARTIYQFCKLKFLLGIIMVVTSSIFISFGPGWILPQILDFLSDQEKPTRDGAVLILILSLSVLLRNVTYVNAWIIFADAGACVGSTLNMAIFRKIFQINYFKEDLVAKVINHCTSDMERVFQCIQKGMLVTGTVVIYILNVIYCYSLLGPWSFLGDCIVIIYCVSMVTLSKILGRDRLLSAQLADKRIKIMHQILTNMKLIKMYAWEDSFFKKIKDVRDNEENVLKRVICIQCILLTASPVVSIIAPMCSIIGYVFCGGNLTPTVAFSVMSLYSCMAMPLEFVPISAKAISEGIVAFRRIQATLSSLECTPKDKRISVSDDCDAVQIVGVVPFRESHTWKSRIQKVAGENSNLEDPSLTIGQLKEYGMNITVKKGQLVGICGVVGSGKSTLLMAISGNFNLHSGTIAVQGSVALVTQEAFIFSGSVQENILFGLPYEEQKYRLVVTACCLEIDLERMHKEDKTEIGERGENISGGQKQRISLARALYSDRDVLLLDDILSAVDVRVSDHIFKNCVLNMLGRKTVLLVTHSVKVLECCDLILLLKNGTIFESGTHKSLKNVGGEYLEMVLKDQSQRKSIKCEVIKEKHVLENWDKNSDNRKAMQLKSQTYDKRPLTTFRSWMFYWKSCGGYFVSFMMFLTIVIFQAITMFTFICLRKWVESETGLHRKDITAVDEKAGVFDTTLLFVMISVVAVVFSAVFKVLSMKTVLLKGINTIHTTLFTQLVKSPLSFFDVTSIGQTTDRFSKDLDICDSIIPFYFEYIIQITILVLLQVLYIGALYPWYLFGIFIFFAIFLIIDTLFAPSVLAFKRLEIELRTPLLTQMSSTIQGMPIIRTFDKQTQFIEKFRCFADKHLAANFMFQLTSNWLRIRSDLIAWGFVTATSLMIVLERGSGTFSPALAGLVMSFLFSMSSMFSVAMKWKADLRGLLTSVERIADYSKNLTSEAPAIIYDCRPPAEWPMKGTITFSDVKLRYRPDMPLVLQGLTACIKGGEKIGIIGRTGAGKSTLIGTLLRLTEICEGSITIDGIDISKIGLKDLRTKIAVIPQDPVIFDETIRWNLDPLGEHDDDQIWDALEKAQLKNKISNEPQRLDTALNSEEGILSVGEKQLFCLARALLRNCKILLLDEATASVDMKTDQCIQNSIRSAFSHCTVLTIAHRLNTVSDYDKILAIDFGKIMEFDTPSSLMERDSFYRRMVTNSMTID